LKTEVVDLNEISVLRYVSDCLHNEHFRENGYKIVFSLHDISVGIALGYGLDDRGSRVRFPAGAGNFSLYHHVQNGSVAHPASYPMDTRGFFPGGKAAGA
jgi:hypothetical protein